MKKPNWFQRRLRALGVSLLETLSYCANDFEWIADSQASEDAAVSCPDYIPDWVMRSAVTG